MFADYHLHTWYSDDSDYPMEQLVRDAIAAGLMEICITDHVGYGIKADWPDPSKTYDGAEKAGYPTVNVKYPAYHAEIQHLRERYSGHITIREGMELGMQVHTIPQVCKTICCLSPRLYHHVMLSGGGQGVLELGLSIWKDAGRKQTEYNFAICRTMAKEKSLSVLALRIDSRRGMLLAS